MTIQTRLPVIIEEMAQEYLEHHRHPSNKETDNIILEK